MSATQPGKATKREKPPKSAEGKPKSREGRADKPSAPPSAPPVLKRDDENEKQFDLTKTNSLMKMLEESLAGKDMSDIEAELAVIEEQIERRAQLSASRVVDDNDDDNDDGDQGSERKVKTPPEQEDMSPEYKEMLAASHKLRQQTDSAWEQAQALLLEAEQDFDDVYRASLGLPPTPKVTKGGAIGGKRSETSLGTRPGTRGMAAKAELRKDARTPSPGPSPPPGSAPKVGMVGSMGPGGAGASLRKGKTTKTTQPGLSKSPSKGSIIPMGMDFGGITGTSVRSQSAMDFTGPSLSSTTNDSRRSSKEKRAPVRSAASMSQRLGEACPAPVNHAETVPADKPKTPFLPPLGN